MKNKCIQADLVKIFESFIFPVHFASLEYNLWGIERPKNGASAKKRADYFSEVDEGNGIPYGEIRFQWEKGVWRKKVQIDLIPSEERSQKKQILNREEEEYIRNDSIFHGAKYPHIYFRFCSMPLLGEAFGVKQEVENYFQILKRERYLLTRGDLHVKLEGGLADITLRKRKDDVSLELAIEKGCQDQLLAKQLQSWLKEIKQEVVL